MADHKENEWIHQSEKYKTEPGQFVTSLKSISERSGCDVSTVRRALEKFKKLGFSTYKSTSKNRLITVVNWRKYQGDDSDTDKQNDKRPTNDRQTTDKRPTTNKNIRSKECKNERKEHIYIDSSSTSQTTSNKKETVSEVINEFAKADADLTEALKAFSEMRSKLKKPLTAYAMKLAISKLQKLSTRKDEQLEIINNSVVNSWQSFYELKKEVKQSGENQLNFTKEDGTFDKEKWAEYKRSQI